MGEACAPTGRSLNQHEHTSSRLDTVQGAYADDDGREVEVQAMLETRRRGHTKKATPLAAERRVQYHSSSAEAAKTHQWDTFDADPAPSEGWWDQMPSRPGSRGTFQDSTGSCWRRPLWPRCHGHLCTSCRAFSFPSRCPC